MSVRVFINSLVNKYTIFLYLIAAIFLLLSTPFFENFFNGSLSPILIIIGSGIFITTFVTSILNFYFQMDINRHFEIISGAEKSGIRRIYTNRDDALTEINSEFEKARGHVEIITIAGTSFFESTKTDIIKYIDRMCANDSNIEIKILLLDPRSFHAIERSILEEKKFKNISIEQFDYLSCDLWINTNHSLDQLEKIMKDKKEKNKNNFKIKVRLYDTAPILLFVQVNKRIFVEQYHYGIPEEEQQTSLTVCIGKRVPVIEYQHNSLPGQLWQSHFKYLWKTSSQRKVYPGFKQMLSNNMKEENVWLKVYEETQSIRNEYLANKKFTD